MCLMRPILQIQKLIAMPTDLTTVNPKATILGYCEYTENNIDN